VKKKEKNQNRGNLEAIYLCSLICSSLSLWLWIPIAETKTIVEEWIEIL